MEEDSFLFEQFFPKPLFCQEATIIESAHKMVNVRKSAWSDLEQNILLKEVKLREKRFFGKFKGSGREKKEREE